MVRILPFLISLLLTLYALFSCMQTKDDDVPYIPKLVWIALIVLVPFVGPIAWLLAARTQRLKHATPGPGRPPAPRPRPVAPDDDPEFLAWLERQRRHKPPAPDKPTESDPPKSSGQDPPKPDDGDADDLTR